MIASQSPNTSEELQWKYHSPAQILWGAQFQAHVLCLGKNMCQLEAEYLSGQGKS